MPRGPVTPPLGPIPQVQITQHDVAVLEGLTDTFPHSHLPKSQSWRRRDAPLDPLLFAAAAASGPHVTRHHYHHHFFPEVLQLGDEEVRDWSQWTGEEKESKQPKYVSKQAPRSQRLKGCLPAPVTPNRTPSLATVLNRAPISFESSQHELNLSAVNFNPPPFDTADPNTQVQCLSRARIPTPHGPAFLHLYRNNRDNKEHLAIVVDPAQLEGQRQLNIPSIRSRSLDAAWSSTETEIDRIVRGAYVGRLTPTVRTPSSKIQSPSNHSTRLPVPAPLVRIHSECFTGETIGSMRCDCGEQLDEALRLISLPVPVLDTTSRTVPGRGVIIYMRQEGRGIGLLSKLRAYNLQDMGHDTVTANLLLGHGVDERKYDVASAILHDLGLGAGGLEEGIRLLTNNPDKVHALEEERVRIVERVAMVPRTWQCRQDDHLHANTGDHTRAAGITLVGAGAAHGEDLEKYLRTKVDRMGHMLTLPPPPVLS